MVRSDHIIAISRYIAGLVKDQFPKIAKRITTIHRGVDINMFDPAKVSAQRVINAAHHLGIPDHKKVVMLPARPSLWKGQQITIEAMAKLDQKDIILVLVGALSGKAGFQQRLTSSIAQLGLEGRVKLAPESQDMPAALMLADVVVMPSLTPEPFGRVAIEAQAMGRPVVAFNHGGAAESIIPGETGWLAEPGNVDSLGTAIAEALALKVRERKQFANRARQHIVANFSTDLMVSKTLSVYGKALKSALV
jgi:glycosyltransferase involved in cell wall biosynthesis